MARLGPTGFWSYTSQDDASSRGRLSQLRGLLADEVQQMVGRTPPVHIFQDVAAIPPGAGWEQQIHEAIAEASFMIPIITPGFLQSEWCCKEVLRFRLRERELGRDDLIFPIYYNDIEDFRTFRRSEICDPDVLRLLSERQWVEFRDLRHRNPASEEVAQRFERLASGIRLALYRGMSLAEADTSDLANVSIVHPEHEPPPIANGRSDVQAPSGASIERAAEETDLKGEAVRLYDREPIAGPPAWREPSHIVTEPPPEHGAARQDAARERSGGAAAPTEDLAPELSGAGTTGAIGHQAADNDPVPAPPGMPDNSTSLTEPPRRTMEIAGGVGALTLLLLLMGVLMFHAAPDTAAVVNPQAPPRVVTPTSFLVFFDWNQASLTQRAASIVADAANFCVRTSCSHIDVEGHNDTSQPNDVSLAVSDRRANAVVTELIKNGVRSAIISAKAYGNAKLLVPTPPGVREPQNRRVEIIVR